MNAKLKKIFKKLATSPLAPCLSVLWTLFVKCYLFLLCVKWKLTNAPMPTEEDQRLMAENVTFMFKSFERHPMAKRLYKSIHKYYPDVQVIIADDSSTPLKIDGHKLKIINLPFNSGLCRGLNAAIAEVKTPFTIRLDDDELLTPYSNFHEHLKYLMSHPEVDLVGISPRSLPFKRNWKKKLSEYKAHSMFNAPKPLIIPHLTMLDDDHIVLGKVPNIFIVRTEKYRSVGYDDNIRMHDHHEFFFRAAGNLVTALELNSFIIHDHNSFDRNYRKFRSDTKGDSAYIKEKYGSLINIVQKDASQEADHGKK